TDPCPCGRGYGRLDGGILGRCDDMFFVKGNNVYPSALENIIREYREVSEFRCHVHQKAELTELIESYGVKRVLRVGSCGTSHPDVKMRDLIIAQGASTDSNVNRMRFGGYDLAALASFDLVQKAVAAAEAQKLRYHVGNIFSADLFYTPDPDMFETLAKYNVYGVEMEAAGIFPIAAEHGVEALAICTVSDNIRSGEALTADERATTFDEMITVALETTVA
ncbi:MAG: hypothetical protein IIB77_02855, partial [Proteobacteria bacterium]|nr:hypothetical protein [Pseudomonadota bacterium]